MGFPEDFKSYPSAGESYKQIGNSVCVPVVEAIAKEILSQNLLSNKTKELPSDTLRENLSFILH
jgi:DNA (cytosine-5)-methyltransferase 1